jgi:hypothetical protein
MGKWKQLEQSSTPEEWAIVGPYVERAQHAKNHGKFI